MASLAGSGRLSYDPAMKWLGLVLVLVLTGCSGKALKADVEMLCNAPVGPNTTPWEILVYASEYARTDELRQLLHEARSHKMVVHGFADRFEELMQKAGVESCKTLGKFRPLVISSEDGAGSDLVTDPGPTSPPSPPPPSVAPTQLEGSRISGDKNIVPDNVTKVEIARSVKGKIVTALKFCLSTDGSVSSVSLLKSSGFPAYDAKIQREMRTWRYRPYVVNGKATPVCSAVTYIYSQK